MLRPLLLYLVVANVHPFPLTEPSPAHPIVTDASNNVSYHGKNSSNIESFLNIRFAEDTSGLNRFVTPKPYSYPHDFAVNASVPGAVCPQAPDSCNLSNYLAESVVISEDCLTLHVDRLADVTATSQLPVMVFIFGGCFTGGTVYGNTYSPASLLASATENGTPVIYVGLK